MFTLLVGSIIGKTIAVTGYLDSNKQKDYGKSLAWYTANIWFQFIDELILCLLFVKFSSPTNTVLNVDDDGELSVTLSDVSLSNFTFIGPSYKNGLIVNASTQLTNQQLLNKLANSGNTLQEDSASSSGFL